MNSSINHVSVPISHLEIQLKNRKMRGIKMILKEIKTDTWLAENYQCHIRERKVHKRHLQVPVRCAPIMVQIVRRACAMLSTESNIHDDF